MSLTTWAVKYGVSHQALAELRAMMGVTNEINTTNPGMSEAGVASRLRLEAARKGIYLWRNNVGALPTETGRPLRYGLANDSKAMNKKIKSGDFIGIRQVLIGPDLVGHTIGQFVSLETKPNDWRFSGSDHENAQLAWAELITSQGGHACFVTGEGSI